MSNKYNPPILYGRNSEGKIVTWKIRVENTEHGVIVITTHGLLNGKLVDNSRFVTSGKNIGRRNATTPFEQAIAESNSQWEHKLKEGYRSLDQLQIEAYSSISELTILLNDNLPKFKSDKNDNLKPMKCQKWEPNKMLYPCLGQPKINGVRCVVRVEEVDNKIGGLFSNKTKQIVLRSKEGLRYEVTHLEAKFTPYINEIATHPIDGELYIYNEAVTSIGGAARNKNNPLHIKLGFVAFDISVPEVIQEDRLTILNKLLADVKTLSGENHNTNTIDGNITKVITHMVYSNEECIALTNSWIENKFEGGVFRDRNATYKFGSRPKTISKLKNHIDSEFIIVDIIPRDREPNLPTFVLENDLTHDTFESNPIGEEALQEEYLINKHKYIGKLATVRYRERTDNGLPFHTNVIGDRDYE